MSVSNIRRREHYQFFGTRSWILRTSEAGDAVVWGLDSRILYAAPGWSFYPFGQPASTLSSPFPFPFSAEYGGSFAPENGILAYGVGQLTSPWAVLIDGAGNYHFTGYNRHGTAANGTIETDDTTPRSSFEITASLPFPAANLYEARFGEGAVMLLTTDGDVWGVGGTGYSLTNFHGIPSQTTLKTFERFFRDAIGIDCFDSGSAVIDADGAVHCVGYDWFGRFGLGSDPEDGSFDTGARYTSFQTTNAPEPIVKVRFQYNAAPNTLGSALYLGKSGTLYFAGDNLHRLCGDPDRGTGYKTAALIPVPGLPPIRDFDANTAAVYALDYDSRLWVWGTRNEDDFITLGNALGTGADTPVLTPRILLSRIKQVHAALDHAFAVRSDEKVYGWGGPMFANDGTGNTGNLAGTLPRLQSIDKPTLAVEGVIVANVPAVVLTANG
jgi:hypothetical protein